eukprot:4832532-Amphidinium_carterae.3
MEGQKEVKGEEDFRLFHLEEFNDSTKALQALVLDAFMKDILTLPLTTLKKNYTEQSICVSLKEHLGSAMCVIEKAGPKPRNTSKGCVCWGGHTIIK